MDAQKFRLIKKSNFRKKNRIIEIETSFVINRKPVHKHKSRCAPLYLFTCWFVWLFICVNKVETSMRCITTRFTTCACVCATVNHTFVPLLSDNMFDRCHGTPIGAELVNSRFLTCANVISGCSINFFAMHVTKL